MQSHTQQQENLALSFVANAGVDLAKPTPQTLSQLVNESLQQSAALSGRFSVVWGPGVCYGKGSSIQYPENLMYVVQGSSAGDYRVVIRGTAPASLYDWLLEDLLVVPPVPWSTFDANSPTGAAIGPGMCNGMHNLLAMKPAAGLPGANLSLMHYLKQLGSAGKPISLTVTGHSSGAALASTLGLHFIDKLDPKIFTLTMQTFAGETAGNQAFASYLEQRFGNAALRIHNTLDLVPHAFQQSDLEQIPTLYEPLIEPPPSYVTTLVNAFINLTRSVGYTQFGPDQPLTGSLNNDYPQFMQQVDYQHIDAYPPLLGLGGNDIVVVGGTTLSRRYGIAGRRNKARRS
ncbi:MAG: lipase family protein [Paraburkholderia sp.]|jgi:hypothetical protein|nr:lipase family protein [Paraburkholderia sp.]